MNPKDSSLPVSGFSPSSHARGFEALEESFHDGKGQLELSFDGTCWKPTKRTIWLLANHTMVLSKIMWSVILPMKPLSLQFLRILDHHPVEGHSILQHRPRLQTPVTEEGCDSKEYKRKQFRENLLKASHQGSATKYKHVYKRNISTDRRAHHSECTLSGRIIRTIQCIPNSLFCSGFLAQRCHIQDFGHSNAPFIGILSWNH